ncbi:MAG: ankyrin repeat domain-containing protein [Phycisphaerae bacterium]|nr:ankyrin repeat domain-containing protein [Phycisphaerae bacterium]
MNESDRARAMALLSMAESLGEEFFQDEKGFELMERMSRVDDPAVADRAKRLLRFARGDRLDKAAEKAAGERGPGGRSNKAMIFKYRGKFKGRHEMGSIWTSSKDIAIARLRQDGIEVTEVNGDPVCPSHKISPQDEAAAKNIQETTPLHTACRDGDLAEIRRYLRAGHEVDARDMRGETPLEIGVGYYNPEVVRVLLEHGADPNAQSAAGGTVLEYARRLKRHNHENLPAILQLLESGPGPATRRSPLPRAANKKKWWQLWK